ncbi:hypothetical protein [Arthrobacter sp. TMS1-12-1]
MAAIHRELAALHVELASLLESPAPAPAPTPTPTTAPVPVTKPSKTPAAGHLKGHVTRLVPASEPSSEHLRDALLAALQDAHLRSSGVHIGLFGSFVGQHLKGGVTLADLAPGGLSKWCHAQAESAGMQLTKDAHDPAVVRAATMSEQ